MKKLFTLLCLCVLCIGSAWAGDYVKVTSAPEDWSGDYLLVYETDAVAWTGVDAANCNTAVTISDGKITSKPDGAVTLTIATMTGGYSIKVNGGANDGKYIKGTSGSNALGFADVAQLNTIEIENDGVKITSNTSVMRYNSDSGNDRFRYFKSSTYTSQKAIQLYKYVEGTTPTKTLESIAVKTSPTKTTYNAGENFDPTGLVVLATYDDESTDDIAYASNESDFTFNPTLTTALQTTNTFVAITYGEKTVNQNITVNALPTYTVTLGDDNSTLTEETGGEGVVLLTRISTNPEYEFAGWSLDNIATETETAPTIIPVGLYHPTSNVKLYPVYKRLEGAAPVEKLAQTLQYDTWTYSGSTTDKSSYRLFHKDSYAESAAFDLSTLSKVVVYGGTFGGGSYNSLTIGDGTNTWKSVTVSGSSQTGKNEYTDGTALSGTGKLRITSNSGSASSNGVRISKVEIYTTPKQKAYYVSVLPATKTLTSIAVTGTPAEFWKGEAFSNEGMTVTAYYDDDTSKDVTASADFTGYDMSTAGNQTVTVTYGEKTTTYNITVKAIENTLETAYTVAEAKAIIDANPADLSTTPVYVKGVVSSIATEWSSQYGNISFNVSADGQTTGDQFQFFRNFKGSEKTKWASADECPAVGDEVIGYGTLTKYGDTYEFAEGNYFVSQSRDVEVSSVGWATVCLPFRATITSDNATAYYVIGTNGTALTKVEANVIPAGEGVLLKSNDGGAAIVTFTASAEAADAATDNMMKGSLTETTFDGTGYKYYILTLGTDDNLGFYWDPETRDGGKTATCPAGKAVLAVPTTGGNAKMFFYLDDDATGINNVEMSKMTNGIRYNLNGQAVGNDFKGVVIVNGKKFVK